MTDDERLERSSRFQRNPQWRGILRPLLIASILTTAIVAIVWQLGVFTPQPPSREEVETIVARDELTIDSRTLDYQIWDGDPHLLFITQGHGTIPERVTLTHLLFDWSPSQFPFVPRTLLPRWRPSNFRYFIDATAAPASLGDVHCTGIYYGDCTNDTEVFGQVNSRAITTLELDLKGSRRRYQVSYPAFMLRLKDFRGLPDDYRWLDAQGRVIWTADQDPSLTKSVGDGDGPGWRSPRDEWGIPLPLS